MNKISSSSVVRPTMMGCVSSFPRLQNPSLNSQINQVGLNWLRAVQSANYHSGSNKYGEWKKFLDNDYNQKLANVLCNYSDVNESKWDSKDCEDTRVKNIFSSYIVKNLIMHDMLEGNLETFLIHSFGQRFYSKDFDDSEVLFYPGVQTAAKSKYSEKPIVGCYAKPFPVVFINDFNSSLSSSNDSKENLQCTEHLSGLLSHAFSDEKKQLFVAPLHIEIPECLSPWGYSSTNQWDKSNIAVLAISAKGEIKIIDNKASPDPFFIHTRQRTHFSNLDYIQNFLNEKQIVDAEGTVIQFMKPEYVCTNACKPKDQQYNLKYSSRPNDQKSYCDAYKIAQTKDLKAYEFVNWAFINKKLTGLEDLKSLNKTYSLKKLSDHHAKEDNELFGLKYEQWLHLVNFFIDVEKLPSEESLKMAKELDAFHKEIHERFEEEGREIEDVKCSRPIY